MRAATHREGFICPVCRFQYESDEQLMTHFDVAHAPKDSGDSSQDSSGVGAVIKKVQQKLFNKPDNLDQAADLSSIQEEENDASQQQQELAGVQGLLQQQTQFGQQYATVLALTRFDGKSRTLFADFLALRRDRIDRRDIETNKLLFRLEKLLLIEPAVEPNKRVQLEQEIVQWIGNKDMPLCPNCGSAFSKMNPARWRHHCRLCGALVCATCSTFLNRPAAIHLVHLAQSQSYSSSTTEISPISSVDLFSSNSTGRKSPSSISLPSLPRSASLPLLAATRFMQGDDSKGGTVIRICPYCAQCLERCRASTQPEISPISKLYEQLNTERTFIAQNMPEYNEMVARLREGDALHSIKVADDLRLKLMTAVRKLDTLSKKAIEQPEEYGTSPAMIRLCSNIRRASIDFAQKWGGMLSDLPTADEVERIRVERERQLAERVEREREQLAKRNMAKQVTVRKAPERSEGWAVMVNAGGNPAPDGEDPFVQQLELIRSYLAQAEADGRTEEAAALRQNFEELKREVRRREVRQMLEGED